MPPYTKDTASSGKLDTIRINMVEKDALSFPNIISDGFIVVVSIKSSVCRSRSPLTLPAVRAGMMNISMTNSTTLTNTYRFRKEEYWISAVIFTLATTEYMLSRATRARIPLNTMMISASLKLLELTVVSLLYTGFIFMY